jgi:rRNA processing protein Gar1
MGTFIETRSNRQAIGVIDAVIGNSNHEYALMPAEREDRSSRLSSYTVSRAPNSRSSNRRHL